MSHCKNAACGEKVPPNVVLVLADDLGYRDLGCYGNPYFETPHLDELARQGLRFADFHSSGAVCSPTRAGLLTGRYQHRAGIPSVILAGFSQNRHHGLQHGEITLAELLKQSGYATGLSGKWHLGYEKQYNPLHHGFGLFRGFVSGNVDYVAHLDRMGVRDWWHGLQRTEEAGYSTHLITKHAVEFIEANRDRPFFLYVAHEAPHAPWQGPDDPAVRKPGERNQDHYPPKHDRKRAFREMVQELDRSVGEIVATLRRLGLDEQTFVFFCSDNGGHRLSNVGGLRGHKGTVWEGGHRVPAIARWPGKIKPGKTDQLAWTLDLMPTVLEMTGTPPPEDRRLDGVSLLPVLVEGESLERRELFWEHRQALAMREGPWKLVWFPEQAALPKQTSGDSDRVHLFQVEHDPGERKDLGGKYPKRIERMKASAASWLKEVTSEATPQPEKPLPRDAAGNSLQESSTP